MTENKTAEIEKHKNDILTQVKQTCGKLKFTLKGSVARDQEFLQMALSASRDRLSGLEKCCDRADQAVLSGVQDDIEVNVSCSVLTQVQTLGVVRRSKGRNTKRCWWLSLWCLHALAVSYFWESWKWLVSYFWESWKWLSTTASVSEDIKGKKINFVPGEGSCPLCGRGASHLTCLSAQLVCSFLLSFTDNATSELSLFFFQEMKEVRR